MNGASLATKGIISGRIGEIVIPTDLGDWINIGVHLGILTDGSFSITEGLMAAGFVSVPGGSSGPVKVDETIKPSILVRNVELKDSMEDIYEKMLVVKSLKIT